MRRRNEHRAGVFIRMALFLTLAAAVPACGGGGGVPASPLPSFRKARGFDGTVRSIARAGGGSGDIFASGTFTVYDSTKAGSAVRVHADGAADAAFAVGWGFNDAVNALVPAGDGSGDVYCGGEFASYGGTPAGRLVRLNPDGSADSGFDVGTGFDATVYAIALAGDGSGDVLVGGNFSTYNGTPAPRIVRLHSDGTVDTGFVNGGFDGDVRSIFLAEDGSGRFYVGGSFSAYDRTSSNGIIRLKGNGGVDSTFVVGAGFDGSVLAIASSGDGSGDLYVGGEFGTYQAIPRSGLALLNADGSVDSGFDPGSGFDLGVLALAPVADGSGAVYVGGLFTTYNGVSAIRMVCVEKDGLTRPTFDVRDGFDDTVETVVPAADGTGDVHVGGSFTRYDATGCNRMVRLNADGSVDPGFPTGSGIHNLSSTASGPAAQAVAVDGSGRVTVGGSFTAYNGRPTSRIARLNPDGSFDPTFAVGTGFGSKAVMTLALAPDGSGDLYAGGDFASYKGTACPGIVRINSDGSVDSAFVVGTGFNSTVHVIVSVGDGTGDVYVGGAFTSYNGTPAACIVRLRPDGSISPTFAAGSGFDTSVGAIVPAGDGTGDVYVGGSFTTYQGAPQNYLARLNSDGSLDSGFDIGTGFNASVNAIAPADDASGDVYLGGNFTTYQGATSLRLIRLNSDGSPDPGFATGTGFDNTVNSILPAGDGSGDVYVGGAFFFYKGQDRACLLRLNADGTEDAGFAAGTGFDDTVTAVVRVPDGSGDVLVVGWFVVYNSTVVDRIVWLSAGGAVR